jgi:hypothetical protein
LADGTAGALRFTLALLDDNRAQGTNATATLRFDAQDDADVLGRNIGPTSTATVPNVTGRAPVANGKPTSTAVPVATSAPTIEVRDRAPEPSAHGFWPSAGTLAAATAKSVTLTAKASTVPAVFVAAILLFLVLQDRIDRNDPKLLKAPMRPEPELVFVPRGAAR